MTLSEKSAYLKGLLDGLKLDTEKSEGKMIAAIIDMLEDVAYSISDIEAHAEAMSDELDQIEEELDAIEECLLDDEELDEDEDEDFDYEDETLYEVKCPICSEVITIDEDTIEEGSIACPKCGEELEFDMDDEADNITF